MRQFLLLFTAALIGGILAATLVLFFAPVNSSPAPQPVRPAPATAQPVPAYFTSTTDNFSGVPDNLPDLKTAARRATPSAVHITARPKNLPIERVKRLFSERENEPPVAGGEGSGVIYNAAGYIVTNAHVVSGAGEILVRTANRRTYQATLVGQDPKSDLAVLKIAGDKFPYLPIADSDLAEPGQWVLAVGNPLGLTSTVTAGIVSAKSRNISLLRGLDAIESFIQTDAAVNPGNSGGPLVTADGKLLGINTAIASRTGRFQGYSFAIPSNLVKRVADDIIEFGSYRRAFLGIDISTLTDRDIRRLQLRNRTEGVVVDGLVEGGSAETAGLLIDDVIINVNKRVIRDLPELTEIIGRAKVGETLNIAVIRNGSPVEVIVPLLRQPE
ncbi:S1C family serine protease [Neolewinella antarctica]|uniref:S1-C subfamily serine protease n=1 Tax=Neolewinella antarctica TaxID=442734 RepID=A0ABX0XBW6_9BACT|nr:trypsin-like peptidase domain-containing protein [Neolewinella antarctica]NJC26707.1 S1-C subfamily serine protease [Neolewinella antarctica]